MSQKLPVGDFKWIEEDNLSKFDEKFTKDTMKIVTRDTLLK